MKYIFLDIDGTLFAHQIGKIPDSALLAMKRARKKGNKIFLCTGRSLAEVSAYLNHEDVDGFVLGAGANVYCENKKVYDAPLKKEDVTKLKKMLGEYGLGYTLEGAAGAYCSKEGYEFFLKYLSGGLTKREDQIKRAIENAVYPEKYGNEETDHIYKICACKASWDEQFEKFNKALKDPYIITKSLDIPGLVIGEISDKNITKATGIHKVIEYYGGAIEDTIGIGDSANDIPMLEECGISIAMGNALQEAKEAADYVTTDILDHGIYNAFEHYHLL